MFDLSLRRLLNSVYSKKYKVVSQNHSRNNASAIASSFSSRRSTIGKRAEQVPTWKQVTTYCHL